MCPRKGRPSSSAEQLTIASVRSALQGFHCVLPSSAIPLLLWLKSQQPAAVMTKNATSHGLPTTMGFAARQAIDALRRRNVATAPVLREAGVSERDVATSSPLNHRISAMGQ